MSENNKKYEVIRVQKAGLYGPMIPLVMGRIGEQGSGLSREEAKIRGKTASFIPGTSVIVRAVPETKVGKQWGLSRLRRQR